MHQQWHLSLYLQRSLNEPTLNGKGLMACTTPAVLDRAALISDPANSWRFAMLYMADDWLFDVVAEHRVLDDANITEVTLFNYSSRILGGRLASNMPGLHRSRWVERFAALLLPTHMDNPMSEVTAHKIAVAAADHLDRELAELATADVDVIVEYDFGMQTTRNRIMFETVMSAFGAGIVDFTAVLHVPEVVLHGAWQLPRHDVGRLRASEPLPSEQLARIAQMRVLDPDMFSTFADFAEVGALI